ncbi:DUF4270 domain-containing protein [Flavivirga jejuensis]|uniref:DUF4270 domain-containing protein n=1 Tax=Flavivirga jejuensis TaxID=870487 RepID=A0ABT8WHX3_9FLAO|nr:DUF4270 domain-containing protein [Flavivirga jejuensis]MDO5972752.1 DUF4270 domain-containing protein [Flavivirga jejuensis]
MKNSIKAFKFFILFLLVTSSFIACDKDFNIIESDVLGKENSNFETKSLSIPLIAYNKKLDSLKINDLEANLLGSFNDPAFGQTTASIVAQVTPTSLSPDFGENPVIDSVILSIPYFSRPIDFDDEGNTTYTIQDSLYGDATKAIKLTIYRNNYFLSSFNPNDADSPQNYFSNASNSNTTNNFALTENSIINFDAHVGAIIKDTTFVPSAAAVITTVGEGDDAVTTRSVPAFRAPLDNAFWKSAIIDLEGLSELSNINNFYDYFRGLYFKVEAASGEGNMILLNLDSTAANITIHYSKGEENARIQDEYSLYFDGIRLNTFINDYISLEDGDSDLGDETLYLKGTEGSMAVVDLFGKNDIALEDFINEFRLSDDDGNHIKDATTGNFILKRLINEAQLVIYEDELLSTSSDDDYHENDRIYAYDVKNNIPIIDYGIDPFENDNDPLNSKVIHLGKRDSDLKQYKIRITEHLNNILLKDSTNTKIGLVLSTNVNVTSNALILESEDAVTAIPQAAIFTPRGTVLHGTNISDENDEERKKRKMKLEVFYTEPENN